MKYLNLHTTLGAIEIGADISVFLLGAVTVQVNIYNFRPKRISTPLQGSHNNEVLLWSRCGLDHRCFDVLLACKTPGHRGTKVSTVSLV